MFGAIMLALGVTAFTVEGIRNSYENSERKEKAVREGRDWYTDNRGKTRYIKDDKNAFITTVRINGSNHKVLKYAGTNTIITDYTQQHFDKISKESYEFAKSIGASVYLYEDTGLSKEECDIPGHKVRDMKTGDIYVIRSYGPLTAPTYYVDIKTGKIVRPTDGTVLLLMSVKKTHSRYKESRVHTAESIISLMNKRNLSDNIEELKERNIFDRYADPRLYEFSSGILYDLNMKRFRDCNINKIYEEGETWEDKMKECSDVGTLCTDRWYF